MVSKEITLHILFTFLNRDVIWDGFWDIPKFFSGMGWDENFFNFRLGWDGMRINFGMGWDEISKILGWDGMG